MAPKQSKSVSQTGSDLNWAACESSSAFLLSLLGIGEAEVKPGSKPGHSIEDHVHFSLCYLGTLNRHICEQDSSFHYWQIIQQVTERKKKEKQERNQQLENQLLSHTPAVFTRAARETKQR